MPSPTATARKVMTLATLADVRTLIAKHLPEHSAISSHGGTSRPNSTKRQPARHRRSFARAVHGVVA